MYWMGIDGGGTHLRIVVIDDEQRIFARVQGIGTNPSTQGYDLVETRLHQAIQQAVQDAQVPQIDGVGVGIAGAASHHARDWLRHTVSSVLPNSIIFPSSDVEIALVAGRGRLDGLVVLAGTGSVAFGRNQHGKSLQAGGWGYLLGDEGSGYWIGLQALRQITKLGDQRIRKPTSMMETLMETLDMKQPLDLLQWVYYSAQPKEIAQLAPLVLQLAEVGETDATTIVLQAATHLVALAKHVQTLLNIESDAITYAGSLLTNANMLRSHVTKGLGLTAHPITHHEPVMGAAMLAQMKFYKNNT